MPATNVRGPGEVMQGWARVLNALSWSSWFCSRCVHTMITLCSRYAHALLTLCSRYVHAVFTLCSRYVHAMFTLCSRYVHDVFTLCSRCVHARVTSCWHCVQTLSHTVSSNYVTNAVPVRSQRFGAVSLTGEGNCRRARRQLPACVPASL
jgi:hypothetical protein